MTITGTLEYQKSARSAYAPVDIAFVMESTYPYLRGGVSAVVHDIIKAHPDKTVGIIHIAWDRGSPHEDVYGMPPNVKWVCPLYLSIREHTNDFGRLTPAALHMNARGRRILARRLFSALRSGAYQGSYDRLWQLYDEGMNPRTRRYPLWALLGSKEFLAEARIQLNHLDISLTDLFWLLREFFSLSYAVMGADYPPADIYHSHTTGCAALASAVAARQHDGRFLLTEHNLYTRDSINNLLGARMDQVVRASDWRDAEDISVQNRAWMAWYIEMGRLAYDAADKITYLYPEAIGEALELGTVLEKSFVLPNGVPIETFDLAHQRFRARHDANLGQRRIWRLAFAARLVPIKGLLSLLEALAILQKGTGVEFTLDVMGHDHETPDYAAECRLRCTELGLDSVVKFRGSQNLREVLPDYDLLVLPSFNEGQPLVVLEAMTIGLPVVGSRVGGMGQLVEDPLDDPQLLGDPLAAPQLLEDPLADPQLGQDPLADSCDSCGVLVKPGDPESLARALHRVLSEPGVYENLQVNARRRVLAGFRLEQAMHAYRRTYGHVVIANLLPASSGDGAGAVPRRLGDHRRGLHRKEAGEMRLTR